VRSTALMCGRTYSSWAFNDLFLGHISPISPSFPHSAVRTLHSPSPFPHLNHSLNIQITAAHHLPTTPCPIAGPSPTSPPTAGRPLAGISSFTIFLPENPFFFSVFLVDCGFCIVCGWFCVDCAGGWVVLKGVFKPFGFWAPTRCSRKFPNQHSSCLEAEAPLLGPLGPKA
jgi:hypothetical protein